MVKQGGGISTAANRTGGSDVYIMEREPKVPIGHELSHEGGAEAAAAVRDLEVVFRANVRSLVRALTLLCDDPADVVQEAFLEAHRRWDCVSGYEDPAAWIRHVAINKARDRIRHRSRERNLLERLPLPVAWEVQREETLDLRDALRRLPARQQLAIALFYVGDLSVEEVASAMSLTPGGVKAALHAGRARLAQLMEVEVDA